MRRQIRPTLRLLGIPTALSAPSLLPYLLAPALLLGPLYATFLDRALPFQTHAPSLRQALHDLDLVAARNYLVVRPLPPAPLERDRVTCRGRGQ